MYHNRNIEKQIDLFVNKKEIILTIGMRRTGKAIIIFQKLIK